MDENIRIKSEQITGDVRLYEAFFVKVVLIRIA